MKIGFISDIHEDITRLKQAIQLLKKNTCDKIVCLGDILGYEIPYYGFMQSRNGHEVIQLLKKECDVIVPGNHDLYEVKKLPEYTAGIKYPKDYYSYTIFQRKKFAKERIWVYENTLEPTITSEDKEFVRQLPEFVIKTYDGIRILFSHWLYPDLVGNTNFLLHTTTQKLFEKHAKFMKENNCILSFCGHTHKTFYHYDGEQVEEKKFSKFSVSSKTNSVVVGPCVANGTFENGVMIFDTKKLQVSILPLKSKLHILPEWRKL